jgi:hypothetical protein
MAPPFLTSALDGGEWSALRPGEIPPGTHWIGDWVGPRAGLDAVEKRKTLLVTGSLSLYRLSYPDPFSYVGVSITDQLVHGLWVPENGEKDNIST